MSTALVGILGVVAGALTTGTVQLWLASKQRRIDARASARVVWGALADVIEVIEASKARGRWTTGHGELDNRLGLWAEHRLALARVVDSYGYRRIDTAFGVVRHMKSKIDISAQEHPQDLGFKAILEDRHHEGRMLLLQEGATVAFCGGQSRWDRIREPRQDKKLDARMHAIYTKVQLESKTPTAPPQGGSHL